MTMSRENFKIEVQESDPNELREFVLILIKPLGMSHLNEIIEVLKRHGNLIESKPILTEHEAVCQHYADSEFDKDGNKNDYYEGLVRYMTFRHSYALVFEDNRLEDNRQEDYITQLRKKVIGASDPSKTESGQVRNIAKEKKLDYKQSIFVPTIEDRSRIKDNLIHCSDSLENSIKEISIWMPEKADKYRDKGNQIMEEKALKQAV
jgi:nucleoside diphosphate kinase